MGQGGIRRAADGGGVSGSIAMWEETVAERLTIISEIDWLYFEPPMLVQPGESFWVKDRTLHVRALDGVIRTVVARASRPDDWR